MNKIYTYFLQFSFIFIGISIIHSSVQAQSYDDCTDAYDITDLISTMQDDDVVTTIQFDNTDATGGEETNPDFLICLLDKVIENSLWVTFTGDGNSYVIGTTECGATPEEYLNSSQAIIYKGECDDLEFISCNEFQQESEAENDFTFKAYLTTEVGVQYYLLLDGGDVFGDPDYNRVGKFCLELEQTTQLSCADGDLSFTWERDADLDKYVCWDEFHTLKVVDIDVPQGITEAGNITGYFLAISTQDLTNVSNPDGVAEATICCSEIQDRVFNYWHGQFGDFVGQYYFKWYYYFNAPTSQDPGFEFFPNLELAECVVGSNQIEMILLPETSDLRIETSTITNSSSAQGNGKLEINATGGSGDYDYLWSNGASGTDLTDLEAGEYTVTLTDLSFCFPPIITTYTIEGITSTNDFSSDKQLNIYPNPTSGVITVSSDDNVGKVQLAIYSIEGKEVYSKDHSMTKNASVQLDLNRLDAGIYIMKSSNGEKVTQQRLVINK